MADRSVKIVLDAKIDGLVNKFRTAQKATADYGKSSLKYYRENKEALDEIGSSALKVGAGLTAVAGFAVKAAMDWETAWTGVLKTVDGTPAQLANLEDGLRDLAVETGFAHREVAAVAEAAGQLGISTGGITKFTETMLAMGVSTNLSSEEAAVGLARFRNIMGSSEAEIVNMGSTIVALGNNFATTEAEILEMSLRLAGAGRQAGLTESEVMALAASMSSVGIEAEAGGTALSMTMKRIGKEVETNGGKLELFARTAGMSAEQFKTAWQSDAAGALTSFVKGLGEAEAMGMSTNEVLRELEITGIREADALLRLSSNAEGLADALGVGNEGWRQNIALMAEADKFYGTTAQKGKQAWAAIKDSAIDAGESLLPVVAKLAEGVAGLAGVFSSLPAPVQGGVTAIAGIAGAGLLAVGGLLKLAGAIENAMESMSALEVRGGKTSRVLGMMARGAAAMTVAFAGMEAAERLGSRGAGEMSKLAKELDKYGSSGKANGLLGSLFGDDFEGRSNRFRRDLRSLGEEVANFSKVGDDAKLTRAARTIGGMFSQGEQYVAAQNIKDLDAALADLSRNKPDSAIKAFERLRDVAMEQGATVDDLKIAFPTMTELLRGASEAMGGTSDATDVLSGDLEDLAPAAQQSAEEMAALQERALGIAESFTAFGDNLDDKKVSLADWTKSLKEQGDALRAFTKNAMEAARKGLDEGLIQSLEEAGPAGALRMRQLADASESEIDRANKAWRSNQDAIAMAVAQMTNVPYDIVTEFKTPGAPDAVATAVELAQKYGDVLDIDTIETILRALDYSSEDIENVKSQIRNLNGDSATVNVYANTDPARRAIASMITSFNNLPFINIPVKPGVATGGRVPRGYVGGGRVPGTPPANRALDNIMAVTQHGNPLAVRSREWIVNEQASDKNDHWLRAVNDGLVLDDVFGQPRGGREHRVEMSAAAATAGRAPEFAGRTGVQDLSGVLAIDAEDMTAYFTGIVREVVTELDGHRSDIDNMHAGRTP